MKYEENVAHLREFVEVEMEKDPRICRSRKIVRLKGMLSDNYLYLHLIYK